MTKSEAPATRSIEIEQEIAAPPEEVWQSITTGEGLRDWFPLEAEVEPGVGGSVWLSWGPGSEGKAPIKFWDQPKHMGWEEDYGEDSEGRPVKVAVDFYIEGRDGVTVVRLVQSGLSAAAEWDDMYDALTDGWTYFMFNLAYYFMKHRGKRRKLVWKRVATDLTRDAVWERLVAGALVGIAGGGGEAPQVSLGREHAVEVASARAGHHYTAAIPELDDSLFFIEVEGKHVGFWLSTYDMEQDRVDALQATLDARVSAALA